MKMKQWILVCMMAAFAIGLASPATGQDKNEQITVGILPEAVLSAPSAAGSGGGGHGVGFRVESDGTAQIQQWWYKFTVKYTPTNHWLKFWLWANGHLRAMAEIIDGGATLCWPLETWNTYTTPYYIGVRNEGGLPAPQTPDEDVAVEELSVKRVTGCTPGADDTNSTPGADANGEEVELLRLEPQFERALFAAGDGLETLRIPEW